MKMNAKCAHKFITLEGLSFCAKCSKRRCEPFDEESMLYDHNIIFIDGVGTCEKCGHCIEWMLDYKSDNNVKNDIHPQHIAYEDILINNNIYWHDKIASLYKNLKESLPRNICSNKEMFAYCTYKIIRREQCYHLLSWIARMFDLELRKFKRCVSKLTDLTELDQKIFALNAEHYYSLVNMFARYYSLRECVKDICSLIDNIISQHDSRSPNIIVASCIYRICKERDILSEELIKNICLHFNCSRRVIREIGMKMNFINKRNSTTIH